MLEEGNDLPEHLGEIAFLPHRRGREVVRLVHDQEVPRQVDRSFGRPARRAELLQDVRLLQVMVGSNDSLICPPRICVEADPLAQSLRLGPVDDVEGERELLPHLLPPLGPQGGRAEDQDAADPAAEDQLGQDETRLDRLAEPHIVGDQERDARHPQGAQERDELEVFHLERPVEGGCDRQALERTGGAVRVDEGGQRGPARGAHERVELPGIHRILARGIGQRSRFEEPRRGLALPDQTILGDTIGVGVLQGDEMEAPIRPGIEGFYIGDEGTPVADRGEHAGARDRGGRDRGGLDRNRFDRGGLDRGRVRHGTPPASRSERPIVNETWDLPRAFS